MTARAPVRRARALRRAATEAEMRLWSVLRNRGVGAKFRRQVPLGPFVADFACASARLVIELDGGQHAESVRDARRDAWLAAEGWTVVRYWNSDVMTNLDGVLADILRRLQERRTALALTPSLSRKRERGRDRDHLCAVDPPGAGGEVPPPLPPAGEGRGEGGRHRDAIRAASASEHAPDVAPPLPLAGEGRGEGRRDRDALRAASGLHAPADVPPPLPPAGEGRGEGGRHRDAIRAASASEHAPDVPPPLPLAGEGRGEGFAAPATPAARPEARP
jgi:very-short-patch-repair endonuclease